ncbi:MAG: glycosyltransferase family 2 protein [Sulfitobacter sp.]
MLDIKGLRQSYRRRLIRKRLLWRAFRKRRELTLVSDKRAAIMGDSILLFSTMRNEEMRLAHFLDHYRQLGVGHFLIVDNDSTDGTATYLAEQPDVSVWHTSSSYKASRFGVDWLNWLQRRYAHDRWSLVVDADEILIYPDWETRDLRVLTQWLDAQGQSMMGALMLDLYPNGPIEAQSYRSGQDPAEVLQWFDGYGYWAQRQERLDNLWLQGGVRARYFFADDPRRAPTLNKIPLVHWKRPYAYVNSTHSALPSALNHTFDEDGVEKLCGVLLHTKFLPGAVQRACEEKARKEHFAAGEQFEDYYDALAADPNLWSEEASKYDSWRQLVDLGLMSRGKW